MKVYLNSITGIDDAIISLYMSKRHFDTTLDENVRETVKINTFRDGKRKSIQDMFSMSMSDVNRIYCLDKSHEYDDMMEKLLKYGCKHTTLLSYIDLSFTVDGLHRGGQDDWDSHAKRFDNRIIRESTRLATFTDEKSDFYKDKILTTDEALKHLNIEIPSELEVNGETYIRATNGYIKKKYEHNKDVKRGLYMLSIPSKFIFNVNLKEFAHVYKMRNMNSGANLEVKECCEKMVDLITKFQPLITREILEKIEN